MPVAIISAAANATVVGASDDEMTPATAATDTFESISAKKVRRSDDSDSDRLLG